MAQNAELMWIKSSLDHVNVALMKKGPYGFLRKDSELGLPTLTKKNIQIDIYWKCAPDLGTS